MPGSNKSKKHSLSVDLKPSVELNNSEVQFFFHSSSKLSVECTIK